MFAGNDECRLDAGGLVRDLRHARQFEGDRLLDDGRTKPAPRRRLDGRSAAFAPADRQVSRFDRPADLDRAARHAESTVFRGIRHHLVQHERERLQRPHVEEHRRSIESEAVGLAV